MNIEELIRERDEAIARAEAAERERDEALAEESRRDGRWGDMEGSWRLWWEWAQKTRWL